MKTIPFLWTNDDITFAQTAELERMLKFLSDFGILGTFFVVPIRSIGTIDKDDELVASILQAQRNGHEFHQHGTRHTPYECGIPELDTLNASAKARRQFDCSRFEIEKMHTVSALKQTLEEGQKIWKNAFGAQSRGFRPGWGAYCRNLYPALDALGFEWVSARIISMTSWRRNFGQWDAPIDFREEIIKEFRQFPETEIMELPMIGGEYAFKVPADAEKINNMVALGMEEFTWCYERNIPFIMVSHWSGLMYDEGAGYEVHRRFLRKIQESGRAEFMTMNALYERIKISTEQ